MPGSKLPHHDIMKEIVRWLGYVLRGCLDKYVVKSAVERYIYTYYTLWYQYVFIPVPPEHQLHIMSFLNLAAFDNTSKLSTKSCTKETANVVDIKIIVHGMLEDKKVFNTHCAHCDSIYSSLLRSLSSSRPGELVESSCYHGSNKALTWEDHNFWVIPNPEIHTALVSA
ncbi:hypothetical protein DFH07DRAFT_768034 [Mycena maculata]|uniref:Uncharacterized protein n=1 Tax=Mycena maculata TaxID=230809 RepID=A0AAD7NS94_9AGAR|nr:hypothetical protein DFH07DRAFT_768034 [Mycena maculata]